MADRPLQQVFNNVRFPLLMEPGREGNASGFVVSSTNFYSSAKGYTAHNFVPAIEKDMLNGEPTVVLEKRQGMSRATTVDTLYTTATITGGNWQVRDILKMNRLTGWVVVAFYRNNAGTRTIEIRAWNNKSVSYPIPWIEVGTISNTAGPPAVVVTATTEVYLSEVVVGGVPGISVIISDSQDLLSGSITTGSSAGYYALSASGAMVDFTLTKIADADFPTNQTPYVHVVGPLIQMNQIGYIMSRNGTIYNTNSDTLGTWSALGFINAQSYPGTGVGLIRYKHHIVGVNENSIEFYDDVGNDPTLGSPLQRTDQAFIKFGCIHAKSMINIEDTIFWVSLSASGALEIYRLDGYTPVAIANSMAKAHLLSTRSQQSAYRNIINLQACTYNGKKLLYVGCFSKLDFFNEVYANLTMETSEPTLTTKHSFVHGLLYGLESGVWTTMAYNDDSTNYRVFYFWASEEYCIAMIWTGEDTPTTSISHSIFQWYALDSSKLFSDSDGTSSGRYNTISVWSSPLMSFGTERNKFLHKYKINAGIKHGSATVSNTEYYKLVLKKEYTFQSAAQTYTRNIKVPDAGNTPPRLYGNSFGAFRFAVFGLIYLGNSNLTIQSAEVDISQGVA